MALQKLKGLIDTTDGPLPCDCEETDKDSEAVKFGSCAAGQWIVTTKAGDFVIRDTVDDLVAALAESKKSKAKAKDEE